MNVNKKGIALILAAVLVTAGCASKEAAGPAEAPAAPTPVQVEAAKMGLVTSEAGFSAKLAPSEEVQVSPKVTGKITTLPVKLGQYVKQGDLLFRLDEQDIQNSIAQAEASYKLSQASLNQAKNSSSQGLEQAKNSLKQAEQGLSDAQVNLQRMQQLFKEGAISTQQFEQAQTSLNNAQTAYDNARESYQSAQQMSNIQVSEASVKQSAVSLQNAREQLANAVVTAPISGYVSSVKGAIGQFASPQGPVVVLVNTNPLIVKANLSEAEITTVKVGSAAKVNVTSLNKQLDAKVTAVSPVMDSMLKAYPIEITIPNPSNELKADMVVNVTFQGQNAGKAQKLIVSRKAVFDRDGKQYVFVINGDVAKEVEVTTGDSSSDDIEVLTGISQGDQVVVKGQTLLKDGSKVTIAK
ncbi:UNVERIFIED_CONTAM: HlyD family secretion protein [Brevibacillus sp. OAP136]